MPTHDAGADASSYHGAKARQSDQTYGSFRSAAGAGEGETVVLSHVVWADKAARDRGMEKFTNDPRVQFADRPASFDGKRLITAGFKPMPMDAADA